MELLLFWISLGLLIICSVGWIVVSIKIQQPVVPLWMRNATAWMKNLVVGSVKKWRFKKLSKITQWFKQPIFISGLIAMAIFVFGVWELALPHYKKGADKAITSVPRAVVVEAPHTTTHWYERPELYVVPGLLALIGFAMWKLRKESNFVAALIKSGIWLLFGAGAIYLMAYFFPEGWRYFVQIPHYRLILFGLGTVVILSQLLRIKTGTVTPTPLGYPSGTTAAAQGTKYKTGWMETVLPPVAVGALVIIAAYLISLVGGGLVGKKPWQERERRAGRPATIAEAIENEPPPVVLNHYTTNRWQFWWEREDGLGRETTPARIEMPQENHLNFTAYFMYLGTVEKVHFTWDKGENAAFGKWSRANPPAGGTWFLEENPSKKFFVGWTMGNDTKIKKVCWLEMAKKPPL